MAGVIRGWLRTGCLLLTLAVAAEAGLGVGIGAVPRHEATAASIAPVPSAGQPRPHAQQERHAVLARAVRDMDIRRLQAMLDKGVSVACCGYWREPAAAHLQQLIAAELGISERSISDVHLANTTSRVRSNMDTVKWGGVAVLYLDEPSRAKVRFQDQKGRLKSTLASRGAVLVVQDGDELVHDEPRRVAWVQLRKAGVPNRDVFDFYIAASIRHNFVAPYDTPTQRRFFRAHTQHPIYWHGFFWSFVGMFCTIFACLPLGWWGLLMLERHWEDVVPKNIVSASRSNNASAQQSLPTLLPVVGCGAVSKVKSGQLLCPSPGGCQA